MQIHTKKYQAIYWSNNLKLRKEKVLISQRFSWWQKTISRLRERDSSCLSNDATSYDQRGSRDPNNIFLTISISDNATIKQRT